MLTYLSLISCLVILVFSKETVSSSDLAVVESQEHNFIEAPSYKRYQQQQNDNGGYNEGGGSSPEPYTFNFDIQDNDNNKQFRKESSDGNGVKGSYGYVDANGLYRTVEYTADSEYGFRAKVMTNEPGMDGYLQDGSRSQSSFPADVVLEVSEPPRGLQYSSSDQNNNRYSGENNNHQQNYQNNNDNFNSGIKGRSSAYNQQSNEVDQYAASNNYNVNSNQQNYGRNLAYDSSNRNERSSREFANNKNANHNANQIVNKNANFINWNANANQAKNFEHQSAFSDGHPVYVDAVKPTKNVNKNNFNLKKSLVRNDNEMNEKVMSFVKNQKFTNLTSSLFDAKKEDDSQQPKKLLLTNLQLEKPIQQFRSMQYFRPFNEIRQKFIGRNPRRYTGYTNDFS